MANDSQSVATTQKTAIGRWKRASLAWTHGLQSIGANQSHNIIRQSCQWSTAHYYSHYLKKQHEFVAPFVLAATMFHPALCQRDSEKTLAQLCCLNLLVFRRPIQWPPLPIRIFLGCRCFPWFSSLCNFVSVLLWPCCFKLHRSKHVPVVFLSSPFPFTHRDSLAFRFSCYICNANTA